MFVYCLCIVVVLSVYLYMYIWAVLQNVLIFYTSCLFPPIQVIIQDISSTLFCLVEKRSVSCRIVPVAETLCTQTMCCDAEYTDFLK